MTDSGNVCESAVLLPTYLHLWTRDESDDTTFERTKETSLGGGRYKQRIL
jgi:hypothetical protein